MLQASALDVVAVSPAQRMSHPSHTAHRLPHLPPPHPPAAPGSVPTAANHHSGPTALRGGLRKNSLLSSNAPPIVQQQQHRPTNPPPLPLPPQSTHLPMMMHPAPHHGQLQDTIATYSNNQQRHSRPLQSPPSIHTASASNRPQDNYPPHQQYPPPFRHWSPTNHQQPQQQSHFPAQEVSHFQSRNMLPSPHAPARSAINISSLINESSPQQTTAIVSTTAKVERLTQSVKPPQISSSQTPRSGRENSTDRPKQKRYRATPIQLQQLLAIFEENPAPNSDQLAELGGRIQMPLQSVVLWFKNRRARVPHPMVQSAVAARPAIQAPVTAPPSQSSMASSASAPGLSHSTGPCDNTPVRQNGNLIPPPSSHDNSYSQSASLRNAQALPQKRKYKKTGAYSKRKRETPPTQSDDLRAKVFADVPPAQHQQTEQQTDVEAPLLSRPYPKTPPDTAVDQTTQAPRSSPRLQAKAAAAAAAMASMAAGDRLPPLALSTFQLSASASSRVRQPQTPRIHNQRDYKPGDAIEVLENGRNCLRSWYSATVVGKVSGGALPTPLSLSSPATPHSISQAATAGVNIVASAASMASSAHVHPVDNPVPILTSLRNDGSSTHTRGNERKSPRRVSSPMASPMPGAAKAKYMVRYAHLVRDTESMVPLEEIVTAVRLRPAPPFEDDPKWKPQIGEAAEAHCDDAWFVVEIKSYAIRKGYLVAFEQGENQWIRRNCLRPYRVWRGGLDWIVKTKVPTPAGRKFAPPVANTLDETDGPAAEALLSLHPVEPKVDIISPGRRSRRLEEKAYPQQSKIVQQE